MITTSDGIPLPCRDARTLFLWRQHRHSLVLLLVDINRSQVASPSTTASCCCCTVQRPCGGLNRRYRRRGRAVLGVSLLLSLGGWALLCLRLDTRRPQSWQARRWLRLRRHGGFIDSWHGMLARRRFASYLAHYPRNPRAWLLAALLQEPYVASLRTRPLAATFPPSLQVLPDCFLSMSCRIRRTWIILAAGGRRGGPLCGH